MSLGQPRGAKPAAAVRDREPAIEVGVDVDAGASIAASLGAGVKLQDPISELDGVVVAHSPLVLEAADAFEVPRGWRGPPGRLGLRRRVREAGIVAWEEPVEDALRLGEGAGLGQAQFRDEAILKGAKEPLDPTLALRRRGGDPADAEFLEGAADLGRGNGSLQLLCQAVRCTGVAMKDPMAIRVRGAGDTIAADEPAEQEEVAMGIFLGAKDAGQYLARGVVDGAMEDEAGPAVLEPGMVAAVHLDEQAGLGHALAAAPMARRASGAGTGDPGLPQQPLYGGTRETQAFLLAEEFGEVVIIRAPVAGAGQGQDARPDRVGYAMCRGAPTVAMRQGGGAMLAHLGEQASDVPDGEAQQPRRVGCGDAPLETLDQDMRSLLLSCAQGDSPSVHGARVTESLSCWGVTKSLSYYSVCISR